eukprot:5606520-Pyramimonas_sp.AAC.1
MTIPRSHLDATEAEKAMQQAPLHDRHQRRGARGRREVMVIGEPAVAAPVDPPPPPPPLSQNILSAFVTSHAISARGRRCLRRRGSAPAARFTVWRKSPCFRFPADFKQWFCASFGMHGDLQLCGLGKACVPRPTATRYEYPRLVKSGQRPY